MIKGHLPAIPPMEFGAWVLSRIELPLSAPEVPASMSNHPFKFNHDVARRNHVSDLRNSRTSVGRVVKAPQRLTSPGHVVERPRYRSSAPMDATVWSVSYLTRQGICAKPWFRHLDFVNTAEEDIKQIFWTSVMEKKHREYVSIPLALRMGPRKIRFFYKLGLLQRRK